MSDETAPSDGQPAAPSDSRGWTPGITGEHSIIGGRGAPGTSGQPHRPADEQATTEMSAVAKASGAAPLQLESVDRFDSDNARPYVQRLERYGRQSTPLWVTVAKVGVVLAVIAAGVAFLSSFRSTGSDEGAAFGGPGAPIVNPTVDEMAQATVQLIGLTADGAPTCSGSGTFVSGDGLILTNAHVVTSDAVCDFESVGVSVTGDSGRPPQLLYRAEVVVVDAATDLAVLRVTEALEPGVPLPVSFPALAVGDSETLSIGDDLRILGYPEIGGDTITFTNGSVSGFTAQAGLGDRALIKTDATIAGGNSGGAAVDVDGRLIGVPTKARASESGPAVDCRPLADTDGDGEVGEGDNCVPIGGFLNGIRPISLAVPLLEMARAGGPAVATVDGRPVVEVDLGAVLVSRPRFSLGQANNAPAQVVKAPMTGAAELCLFVDWSGIPNGAEWDALWYHDGDAIEDYGLRGQRWEFGEAGSNFWMCAIDEESGLGSGLYEIGFFLNGELVFAEGIVVADDPLPVLATVWENLTDVEVCGLAVNPAGSGPVGLDELPPDAVIAPGDSIEIQLPAGTSVVEAYDCAGQPIADSAGTIAIEPETTYTITTTGG